MELATIVFLSVTLPLEFLYAAAAVVRRNIAEKVELLTVSVPLSSHMPPPPKPG